MVLDKDVRGEKPNKVDKETEVEELFLQHCDILGFIRNNAQQFLFLDLEVMINLTDNLIFEAQQRFNLFPLGRAGDL